MSVLGDFEELCEKQDNTIEFRLCKYATQDKCPLIVNSTQLFEIGSADGVYRSISNEDLKYRLIYGRTYIHVLRNYSYVESESQSDYMYFIGSSENGFEYLTPDQWVVYINSYAITWGEKEADKLNNRIKSLYEYIR
jgi:hypothetical protein